MDRERFDAWTRLFSSRGSRRGALSALLGTALLPAASSSAARGKKKRKKKRKAGQVTVCHSGETLRVPRYAVRAVLRDGGTRGACPPGGDGQCRVDDDCPGEGDACCGRECVDVSRDPQRCGSCTRRCDDSDQICVRGRCERCDVCADGCEFSTITDALTQADMRFEFIICPGRYRDRVRIARHVSLRGVTGDPRDVVLDGESSASQPSRAAVVTVEEGGRLELHHLTVTGGVTFNDAAGGGITNRGRLFLNQVSVTGNTARFGGGIANIGPEAQIDLTTSDINGNRALVDGGGLRNDGGQVLVLNRTRFRNNTADEGGGLHTTRQGRVEATDAEFTNNTAVNGGGLANVNGVVELTNTAVIQNRADGRDVGVGGGIFNRFGTVTLRNRTRVIENRSVQEGGGVYNVLSTLHVDNSSDIRDNEPDDCFGGTGCPE